MSTDRWRTLEALYHAALERPSEERAAFLAEACQDETLRREVLALLEQPSIPEFLGGQAIAVAAAMVDEVHASQWIGRRIGVYHLQTLLGKGGMGEVYRARDTRLGRDVAVKVLPRAFTADPDRLARFEREARVLASLNHPHIGTIHGLEESEGVRALVSSSSKARPWLIACTTARSPFRMRSRWHDKSPTPSRPLTTKASSIAI